MTFYICNRRKLECGMACGGYKYDWFCNITSDYNYAINKGKPMTFLVGISCRPAKELINKGPANLFEIPYLGTDDYADKGETE